MRHIIYYLLVLVASGFSQNWELIPILSEPGSAIPVAVATDSFCLPRVAFGISGLHVLGYASWTGDSWKIEYPEVGGVLVLAVQLCLDADGLPHIAYHEGRYVPPYLDSVRYAFYDGDTWHFETVVRRDTGEGGIGWLTFALARDQTPHLVFVHDNKVKYAYKSADTWNILTVPAEQPDTLKNLSSVGFALDTSGLPGVAVSWFKRNVGVFTSFFEFDGTGWHRFDFDSLPPGGGGTLVQNDPATDLFHILDGPNYAIGKGREWWIGEGPPGSPIAWRSFALFQGQPHVIFSHPMNYLWYFRREAGRWVGEKVISDRSADCGSITVDRTGTPHIAFLDLGLAETLWYARRIATATEEEKACPIYKSRLPKELFLTISSPVSATKNLRLTYGLPKDERVQLAVYDLSGRTTMVLKDEMKKAGYYTEAFNLSRLSNGIYWFILKSGGETRTRKLALVK
ncbi:MAG: T9SS type A sorting domain-containing protein [candidate division WOR-3 bacterium]